MTGCSALHCSNRSNQGFTLVRFPVDSVRREKWAKATGRQNWTPKVSNYLCEVHFFPEDWEKYRCRLKLEAVPSIFCDCMDNCENVPPALPKSRPTEHSYAAPRDPPLKKRRILGEIPSEHNYVTGREKSSRQPKRKREDPQPTCPIITKNVRSRQSAFNAEISLMVSTRQENLELPRAEIMLDSAAQEAPAADSTVSSIDLQGNPVFVRSEELHRNLDQEFENQEDLHKENARLRNKVESLQLRIAKVKEERKQLQVITKVMSRDLKNSEKKFVEANEKYENLNSLIKGRFSETQLAVAMKGTVKGRKWDLEAVKKALKIKCTAGPSGLRTASNELLPLPSARTLRRKISHIKFEPGIQFELLEDFKAILLQSKPSFRDCFLFFDDMAIKPGTQLDKGTDHFIGRVTLPGVTCIACKATAFVFGGASKNWKLLGAYHFVPAEIHAGPMCDVITDLLFEAKRIGLNVLGAVCDMGNRAVLKKLGFQTKKDCMVVWIPNPADPSKKFYLIPDIVHVFKSSKEMLSNNEKILLPQDIVDTYQLPSPKVRVSHIEWLVDFQNEMSVKLNPNLSKHFNKMKVAPSRHVYCDKTANALSFLVQKGDAPPEFEATAWFASLMDRWFKLMTSRTRKLALSHHDREKYDEAVGILRLVIYVFQCMVVSGGWKPVQTHVIMATIAVLELAEYLLTELNYDFVMVGRFLQDLVENLFSLIRSLRPNPTAVEFKYRLRDIVVSQFAQYIPTGSYDHDDRVDVLDLLLTPKATGKLLPVTIAQLPPFTEPTTPFLTENERNVLYRMSGYIVWSLIQNGEVPCETCQDAMQTKGHRYAEWTPMTNFKEDAQVEVSAEVFGLILALEFNLRNWMPIFKQLQTSFMSVLEVPLRNIPSTLPTCHGITLKILKRFAYSRLKKAALSDRLMSKGVDLASKSMGGRMLAKQYNGRKN